MLQKHFSDERAPMKCSGVLRFYHDSQQIIPMDPSKGLRPQGQEEPGHRMVQETLEYQEFK